MLLRYTARSLKTTCARRPACASGGNYETNPGYLCCDLTVGRERHLRLRRYCATEGFARGKGRQVSPLYQPVGEAGLKSLRSAAANLAGYAQHHRTSGGEHFGRSIGNATPHAQLDSNRDGGVVHVSRGLVRRCVACPLRTASESETAGGSHSDCDGLWLGDGNGARECGPAGICVLAKPSR